jgi:hypothetical protein
MKNYSKVAAAALVGLLPFTLKAVVSTDLPLRQEAGTAIYHANTSQTIESTYGTNLGTLSFSQTTTYDFYSPPLAAAMPLAAADKGGGKIFMRNVSLSTANDFSVSGRMRFYDYDPATGTEALIVDTGSSPHDVHANQTVNWPMPNPTIGSARTVSIGHLLHVAVIVTLVSGSPAGFGQFLYNGALGTSTVAYLPQELSKPWSFATPTLYVASQTTNSVQMLSDGCSKITCAGAPNQTYLVQATASLSSPAWTTIATNTTGPDGLFVFVDADAPNFPARFYRTSTP